MSYVTVNKEAPRQSRPLHWCFLPSRAVLQHSRRRTFPEEPGVQKYKSCGQQRHSAARRGRGIMAGRVGDLSPLQKDKLDELRVAASDVLQADHDDYFLLRWLRARNFDVGKAEAMLRKNLVWQKQFGIGTTLNDFQPTEVQVEYLPISTIGFDKSGCPVTLFLYGRLDVPGILNSVKKTDAMKYFVKTFENDLQLMKSQSLKLGRVIETHSYIFDMTGFTIYYSVLKAAVELIGMILCVYEANYPERLKKALLINAPSYFLPIFALIKPFLSEETVKKISIHGKDGWQEELLADVDADVLPAFLGGTRTDPDGDPMCPSLIKPGGPIPEKYFLRNQSSTFHEETDIRKVTVPRKDILSVPVEVSEEGAVLHWKFQTTSSDISVAVYYVNDKMEEWEEVIPAQRFDCHLLPESGAYLCDRSGQYVVQFDNSSSWFRDKELIYRVGVLPPVSCPSPPM